MPSLVFSPGLSPRVRRPLPKFLALSMVSLYVSQRKETRGVLRQPRQGPPSDSVEP